MKLTSVGEARVGAEVQDVYKFMICSCVVKYIYFLFLITFYTSYNDTM